MSSAENGLLVTSDPGARAGADHTSNIRHGAHVAIDMAVAAAAILLLMPLFMLIAILVLLDSPGPILFRQERTGLNGRKFNIYKFRTMCVQENGPIVLQASRSDARVTRIGKFLRRSSLDELPQLLNVINPDHPQAAHLRSPAARAHRLPRPVSHPRPPYPAQVRAATSARLSDSQDHPPRRGLPSAGHGRYPSRPRHVTTARFFLEG